MVSQPTANQIIALEKEKWKYFVQTNIWPKRTLFDPENWLQNFKNDDLSYARRLLNHFTYFNSELVNQIFYSAFLDLSQKVVAQKNNLASAQNDWARFLNTITIVGVPGEEPSSADSSFRYARLARDLMQIDDFRIIPPEQAIAMLRATGQGNVVFVDDFVGSGNQFLSMWTRPYEVRNTTASFADLARTKSGIRFFYATLVCTETGRGRISAACPEVHISAAHILSERYSAIAPNSFIWQGGMEIEGPKFIEKYSLGAGIPDSDGGDGDWRGYHKLALAIAFDGSWPDATLPFFSWQENGWKPLLKKGI